MKEIYFKMVAMKTIGNKRVLIAAVDEDIFGKNLPDIFEVQAFKMPATIYTGTFPQIKINTDTVKDRTDLIGAGVSGIVRGTDWYCKEVEKQDLLGIEINKIRD